MSSCTFMAGYSQLFFKEEKDLRDAQRSFLLGGQSGVATPLPAWNVYRSPAKHYASPHTPQRPPLIPHPPPSPYQSSRGPNHITPYQLTGPFERLSVRHNPLEDQLIEKFKQLPEGNSYSARNLAKLLRVEKKVINHHLYRLEKHRILFKEGDKPPLWKLASGGRPPAATAPQTTPHCSLPSAEEPLVTSSESVWSADNMAENREKICEFLYDSPMTTSANIRKSIGLTRISEVNLLLNTLEREGEIMRQGNPVKWSLTEKQRARMFIKRRATEIHQAEQDPEQVKVEESSFSIDNGQQEGGLETSMNVDQESGEQPAKKVKREVADCENGQWASDEVSELVNTIGGNNCLVPAAASVPVKLLTRLEKLKACQEKNPVSGLLEFAHYCSHECEFTLVEQSGPSHEPRFKMQAVIDARSFPVAEASSKKNAKKEAASLALRILLAEEQGRTEADVLAEKSAEPEVPVEVPKPAPPTPLVAGKNPVSILMEHAQKTGSLCEFQLLSQEGPPHDPKFTYYVRMGDQTFPTVVANSKKMAKQLAAEAAVQQLLADNVLQAEKVPEQPTTEVQTMDYPPVPELTAEDLISAQATGVGEFIKYLNANPVSGLFEYSRAKGFAAEFKMVSQSGPPHDPKFVFQAKVGGRWFPPVTASNKKQAKAEAADAALRVLIGEAEKAFREGDAMAELPVSGSTMHDKIAMLSHQKFNSLTARIQNSLLGRKVLAAFIMKKNADDLGTVVSIGTGNRCVKGEELSLRGETVNDCHAEVIARRGFIRFLYDQLLKYDPKNLESSIFQEAPNNLLRVQPGVTFHLYISTAPCGDGALFDKSCSDQPCHEGTKHFPLFENPKQGKLRTKVENGEGTIPVESSDIVPTWDGIQHGERLRTMSCSDKILRWNVLGIQGGVLTHFIEPIYLSSVTLGYLFSHGHLVRAICCRMTRDGESFQQQLPNLYTVNHPEVGRVSVYDSHRQTGKTKESSVNWCTADEEVEILDGTKGKVEGGKLETSRVSKLHMFTLFQKLCTMHGRQDLLNHGSYSELKDAATDYQTAKELFLTSLNDMGYGNWISKPQEEKSFTLGTM